MSVLETEKCGHIIQALGLLFESGRFTEQDYANASAYISQRGVPTEEQDECSVVKTMLSAWGIGFDLVVSSENTWEFDSIHFLNRNSSVLGFVIFHSSDNWRCVKRADANWEWQNNALEWASIEQHEIIHKIIDTGCPSFIVWKQWAPVLPWIMKGEPFYIRNGRTKPNVRYEYEPTSCYLPQRTKYEGKEKAISKMLRKWASPCLISNATQFISLTPGGNGWESENIMEFDGLPLGTMADRLSNQIMIQLEKHMEQDPKKKKEMMPFIAHALMSVATRFNIKINYKHLSAFDVDEDETAKLQQYESQMQKILSE